MYDFFILQCSFINESNTESLTQRLIKRFFRQVLKKLNFSKENIVLLTFRHFFICQNLILNLKLLWEGEWKGVSSTYKIYKKVKFIISYINNLCSRSLAWINTMKKKKLRILMMKKENFLENFVLKKFQIKFLNPIFRIDSLKRKA